MSIETPFVSIRAFDAVPNDSSPNGRRRNTKAFKEAQAKMKNDPFAWGHPLFVPSGTFYLADDLHISKSLELFGTGAQGESILMFPQIFKITNQALECLAVEGVPDETVAKLKDLLDESFLDAESLMDPVKNILGEDEALAHRERILKCAFRGTSLIIDRGDGRDPAVDGSECLIRDIQIISEENWVTNMATPFDADNFDPPTLEGTSKGIDGIRMGTSAIIQRVYVKGFTGTGIHIKRITPANVNQWRIHDVYIESCGGHGIHVDGGEAQGGICTGAKIFTVAGTGIYENSLGGNTYVGCYVEETKGRGYASGSPGQTSFIGCFAEAVEPVRLSAGGNVWVGGSNGGFTDDTQAFIAEGYGNVHPFEVPNLKDPKIKLVVGYPNDGSDPTTVCAWANNNTEFHVMRWDMDNKIWTIENGSVVLDDGRLRALEDRNIVNYLTGNGHPRGPWLQGFGEILLGRANSPIKISYGERPADGTGEPGDICYLDLTKADPQVGDHYIGYICMGVAREWKPFGKIEA